MGTLSTFPPVRFSEIAESGLRSGECGSVGRAKSSCHKQLNIVCLIVEIIGGWLCSWPKFRRTDDV